MMAEAPKVYAAIASVARALSRHGIAKTQVNAAEGYRFRGVDDVTAALSPLLVRHRLCMLPRMLERGSSVHRRPDGEALFAVWVRAAFDFVSTVDGSRHSVETYGEAIDGGDKGTAKAMSAAFKYAAFQSFCIPVSGIEDADAETSPRVSYDGQVPVEGWEAWGEEIIAIIGSCVTDEAVDLVRSRHHVRLRALSKTNAALYARIGDAIEARRATLTARIGREVA